MRRASSRGPIIADSYEPGTLDQAWAEYVAAHPTADAELGFVMYRAGYRRGIAQGALMAASTIVHSVPDEEEKSNG